LFAVKKDCENCTIQILVAAILCEQKQNQNSARAVMMQQPTQTV